MTPRLTVGITTRNRADSLNRCLRSLDVLRSLRPEVLVFDDGSHPPAVHAIPLDLPARVVRDQRSPGYIVGRNRLVREAAAPAVLLLDDDTCVLSRESIEQALAVLDGDPRVAAVAFAQAEADGRPWPARMQPSAVAFPCLVASFIGFAHLVRREVFLALGGYREEFNYLGEEKELCLRLLDAGYCTVYLPASRIRHLPAPRDRFHPKSRSSTISRPRIRRRARSFAARNACMKRSDSPGLQWRKISCCRRSSSSRVPNPPASRRSVCRRVAYMAQRVK